jgi:hypothetical protein
VIAVPVTQDDHLTAYKRVVSSVGPLRLDVSQQTPLRDELDTLLVRDLVTQTRRLVDYGNIGANGLSTQASERSAQVRRLWTLDRDGMPDYWEHAVGLKPSMDDHNAEIADCVFAYVPAGVGYTALEDSGLAPGAVYTTRDAVGGSVTVLPDGFTAHFVPDVGFVGRGGFAFAGVDKDKSTLSETVGILVATKAP